MVGAAVRTPRVPNDKLHRVTDNRLAEMDRKDLHGVCRWSRLARYGGLPVLRALKVFACALLLLLGREYVTLESVGFCTLCIFTSSCLPA